MSEQSGPITREQVERAIAKPRTIDYRELPLWWREWAPDYVIAAEAADDWDAERAALTRWRDELVAAETPRKVARWDARRGAYVALDGHGTVCMITPDRETAIAWGYAIEGGHEPERDWKSDRAIAAIWPTPKPAEDSPERLRERREGIPWTLNEAAAAVSKTPSRLIGGCVPWQAADVSLCEGKSFAGPAYAQCRALYAAALSAEEARLAAEGADRVIAAIGRPAPRFKVGDRVTSGLGGPWKIGRVEWGRLVPEADCDEWVYHHASGNVSACESVLALAWTPTPASPPAPEVVDVPQPTVKRCACPDIHDDVEAEWRPGEPYLTVTHTTVPLALLRAMLEAIDAQQGGA